MAESTPITERTPTPDDETANPLQIERLDEESRASEDTAGSLLEAAQGRPLRLPQRAGAHRETTRAPYWFWLLGLLNNASYVIMIASAKSIDAGGVAVVYLVAIGPGLAVKASAPYWFDLVRYEKRLFVAALSMVGGFLLAGLGGRRPLQLLGVALTSFQSALGEATLLALAARHDEGCVSAWSSGTGFAGIVGYGWVWLFTRALRVSMAACQSVAALSLPLLYVLASRRVTGADEIRPRRLGSFWERTRFGLKLWPTTGALFLVYFSEYALQSGVWASNGCVEINAASTASELCFPHRSMGVPQPTKKHRQDFYLYANWLYQVGVLVSRSSGPLFATPPSNAWLWAASGLQAVFLCLFAVDAATRYWYASSVLVMCVLVGLLGGGVYVHGFRRLSVGREPELAMPVGALAADAGIVLANVMGLFLQAWLYEVKGIDGAAVPWRLPGCRERW